MSCDVGACGVGALAGGLCSPASPTMRCLPGQDQMRQGG